MNTVELKPGYLVELRNKEIYMVMPIKDRLILARQPEYRGCNECINVWLDAIYDNKNNHHTVSEYDIMKIYGNTPWSHKVFDFSIKDREVLWIREKKKYTYTQLREILGEEFEVVG